MFSFRVDKNLIMMETRDAVTSGSVEAYDVQFEFSPEWDDMSRTAVFRAGDVSVSVLLDETNRCVLPWEVAEKPGVPLYIGIFGTRGETVILPTVWVFAGVVLRGTEQGDEARPPTPDVYQQILAILETKGDGLEYQDSWLSLMSGDRVLDRVPVEGGGGGTMNHDALINRELENQHPIEAISGLDEITALDVIKIWIGDTENGEEIR